MSQDKPRELNSHDFTMFYELLMIRRSSLNLNRQQRSSRSSKGRQRFVLLINEGCVVDHFPRPRHRRVTNTILADFLLETRMNSRTVSQRGIVQSEFQTTVPCFILHFSLLSISL